MKKEMGSFLKEILIIFSELLEHNFVYYIKQNINFCYTF